MQQKSLVGSTNNVINEQCYIFLHINCTHQTACKLRVKTCRNYWHIKDCYISASVRLWGSFHLCHIQLCVLVLPHSSATSLILSGLVSAADQNRGPQTCSWQETVLHLGLRLKKRGHIYRLTPVFSYFHIKKNMGRTKSLKHHWYIVFLQFTLCGGNNVRTEEWFQALYSDQADVSRSMS